MGKNKVKPNKETKPRYRNRCTARIPHVHVRIKVCNDNDYKSTAGECAVDVSHDPRYSVRATRNTTTTCGYPRTSKYINVEWPDKQRTIDSRWLQLAKAIALSTSQVLTFLLLFIFGIFFAVALLYYFSSSHFRPSIMVLASRVGLAGMLQLSQSASAARSSPPILALAYTRLIPIDMLSATVP